MALLVPVDSLLLFTQLKMTFIRDRCCHLKINLQTRENIFPYGCFLKAINQTQRCPKAYSWIKERLDGEEDEKSCFQIRNEPWTVSGLPLANQVEAPTGDVIVMRHVAHETEERDATVWGGHGRVVRVQKLHSGRKEKVGEWRLTLEWFQWLDRSRCEAWETRKGGRWQISR